MLSTTRSATSVTVAALLLASLGLAGCGSYTQNGTVTHTAALNTAGGRDTARSGVQAAILIADTTNGIALPGGPTPAGIARRVFSMRRGAAPPLATSRGRGTLATGTSTGPCNNGVKTSAVTNGDGSRTTTTDYYYDAACATLEAEESISITTPAAPQNTAGTGTITSYDRSGAVRVVQKLTFNSVLDSGQETLTLTGTAASTAAGTATSGLGATCTGIPPSATVQCTVAHWGTSAGTVAAGTVSGESIANTATAGTGGANPSSTVGVSFYAGTGLGVMQNAGTTNWVVSNAAPFNSASGTFNYAAAGPAGSGTLTLKDSLYTYTETVTLAATGLTITIVENPNGIVTVDTPIATASIDVAGTGVLSYADGTSEPISGNLIGY